MEKHENHKYLCFLLFTIAHRKLTWARRLVQIQSCPEYSHILSRNQSRCKGNYSEVHKVGRKEKDVNKSNIYILIILFIIYYNSCLRIIILHYVWCELWFSRMHCFRNSKISDHWNISNPNERRWFWRKNTFAVLGRHRLMDKRAGKIYICEWHFKTEDKVRQNIFFLSGFS